MTVKRLSFGYASWSLGPIALAAAAMWWLLGGLGLLIASFVALPWVAWRYDNEAGAFLPLTVLLLLVLAVLGLVLFLTALVFFAGH